MPSMHAPRPTAVPPSVALRGGVAEGEAIIVQVVADGYADKGPKLSTDISLPGHFIVYAPYRDMLSVSRRIDDEDERERLQDVVDEGR